jgi:hypothetical protein
MKLRREVLVPLLAIGFSIPSCGQPGLPSGPPARVKWIVDLKKDSGFALTLIVLMRCARWRII